MPVGMHPSTILCWIGVKLISLDMIPNLEKKQNHSRLKTKCWTNMWHMLVNNLLAELLLHNRTPTQNKTLAVHWLRYSTKFVSFDNLWPVSLCFCYSLQIAAFSTTSMRFSIRMPKRPSKYKPGSLLTLESARQFDQFGHILPWVFKFAAMRNQ